jgi:hypothetical protein
MKVFLNGSPYVHYLLDTNLDRKGTLPEFHKVPTFHKGAIAHKRTSESFFGCIRVSSFLMSHISDRIKTAQKPL